jgi:hypothetical protein
LTHIVSVWDKIWFKSQNARGISEADPGYLAREELRAVLGVPENYTQEQLKEAYRTAAKRTRPDLGGDYEEFLRIQAAYEALT